METTKKVPPEPPESALIQAMSLVTDPIGYMSRLRNRFPRGYTLSTGVLPMVHYLVDPKDISELARHPEQLCAGRTNARIGSFDLAFGSNSVVVLDGEKHKRTVSWLKESLDIKKVLSYLTAARNGLRKEIDSWPRNRRFELYRAIRYAAAGVISELVLGIEGKEKRDLVEDLIRYLDLAENPALWLVAHKGRKCQIRSVIDKYIELRRENPRADILSSLIQSKPAWARKDDLRDNAMTLLVLGHEGMSAATTWCLYFLLKDPELVDRIRKEAQWLVAQKELKPGDIKATPLLGKLKQETLRLMPALVSVHRQTSCPMYVGDWEFEKNSCIGASMLFAHRHNEAWIEPDEFKIDRFDTPPASGSYFPFGLAPRSCLGEQIANHEIRVLVAEIIDRLGDKLRITDTQSPEIALRGNILTPKAGMPVTISA